jgi:hypothetical protein
LKKCRPTKRDGRFVVAAISVMERDDGVGGEDRLRPAGGVEGLEHLALDVEALGDDLDDEVALPMRARSVVPLRRPRTSALRSGVTLPFSTPLDRKRSMLPRPFLRKPSSTSRTRTW